MRKSLVIFLLVILTAPVNALIAGEAAYFEYEVNATDNITLQVGTRNLRTDFEANGESHSIIYRGDTRPAVAYLLEDGAAVRFTRSALERVAAHFNIRFEEIREQLEYTLEGMSEEQRQELLKTMPDFESIDLDSPPLVTFDRKAEVTWEDFEADSVTLSVNNEKRGAATLLRQPPVKLSEPQKQTLTNFQELLNVWIEIVSRQPTEIQAEDPYEQTQNLVIEYLPRLAKFANDTQITMRNWGLKPRDEISFKPDDEMPVEAVGGQLLFE